MHFFFPYAQEGKIMPVKYEGSSLIWVAVGQPVRDNSFLSAKVLELCGDLPIFWLKPTYPKGNILSSLCCLEFSVCMWASCEALHGPGRKQGRWVRMHRAVPQCLRKWRERQREGKGQHWMLWGRDCTAGLTGSIRPGAQRQTTLLAGFIYDSPTSFHSAP